MNKFDRNSFFAAAASIASKKPAHKSTGARLLSKCEPLIRAGVSMGLNNLEIAQSLDKMPQSPFQGAKHRGSVNWSTAAVYVSQARKEMGITRPRNSF